MSERRKVRYTKLMAPRFFRPWQVDWKDVAVVTDFENASTMYYEWA